MNRSKDSSIWSSRTVSGRKSRDMLHEVEMRLRVLPHSVLLAEMPSVLSESGDQFTAIKSLKNRWIGLQ